MATTKPIRQVTKTITPAGSNLILLDDGISMGKATLEDGVSAVAGDLIDTAIDDLDLGTAAQSDAADFATAAQGTKADSAVQPGDIGTMATETASDYTKTADLAAVATSNDYGDLSNLPTLGTGAALDAPSNPDLSTDTDKLALRGDVLANIDLLYLQDGSDVTTTLQAAIDTGLPKRLPAGTFLISSTLLSKAGSALIGAGNGKTILKRSDASTISAMMDITTEDFVLEGITFDGNKANNANAVNLVSVTDVARVRITNSVFKNAKAAGGGFGAGLVINGTAEASDIYYSVVGNTAVDNEGSGIITTELIGGIIAQNHLLSNGGNGLSVANGSANSANIKLMNIVISGNVASFNGRAGITVGNLATNGDYNNPDFGYEDTQANYIVISGNVARNNQLYGIAAYGLGLSVTGNVASGNSINNIAWAGILFNGIYSSLVGNTSDDNVGRGFECGGAQYSTITGNTARNNPYTGMSTGGCVNCLVSSNVFIENGGSSSRGQIISDRYDGGGSDTSFDWEASGNTYSNNYFQVSGNQRGIEVRNGPSGYTICNNTFVGGNPFNYIVCVANNARIFGNHAIGSDPVLNIDANNKFFIPDVYLGSVEPVQIANTGTINVLATGTDRWAGEHTGVVYCNVTNGGSGYTSLPSVSFSGGGSPSINAVATAMISKDGVLRGIRMSVNGSGYSSAPTVSISGGGGTGAAATALIRCPKSYGISAKLQSSTGTVTIPQASGAPGAMGLIKPGGESGDVVMRRYDTIDLSALNGAWRVVGRTTQEPVRGTYTPTLTSVENIDSVTAGICHYEQRGNFVDVWGPITIDPTAASVATTVGLSLPIASNLALGTDLSGVGATKTGLVATITGDATNDRATYSFTDTSTGSQEHQFRFSYEVK